MLKAFPPVINKNCKVLILGTMPGIKSLEKQQYYGHERNTFWRIIYSLFQMEPEIDYNQKKAFLLRKSIALWDVLEACEREGSSDSNIKNPVPNDFKMFFSNYPNIQAVYFNGEPAQRLFQKHVLRDLEGFELPCFRLPSTSPANTMRFEEKLQKWYILTDRI